MVTIPIEDTGSSSSSSSARSPEGDRGNLDLASVAHSSPYIRFLKEAHKAWVGVGTFVNSTNP